MYASSFILTLDRLSELLERALELETFRQPTAAVKIADTTIAVIEEFGELTTVALPNVALNGFERTAGDDAVESLFVTRFEHGFDTDIASDTLEQAREADRITEVGNEVVIPIGERMPAVRNWWLLANLLTDALQDLQNGFRRVHRRAMLDGSDRIETAFWTISERVAALFAVFTNARTVGQYTHQSVQQGATSLIEATGKFATAVAEGDDA